MWETFSHSLISITKNHFSNDSGWRKAGLNIGGQCEQVHRQIMWEMSSLYWSSFLKTQEDHETSPACEIFTITPASPNLPRLVRFGHTRIRYPGCFSNLPEGTKIIRNCLTFGSWILFLSKVQTCKNTSLLQRKNSETLYGS